eukprot:13017566-Ditylum_brightwellii.AAC.1
MHELIDKFGVREKWAGTLDSTMNKIGAFMHLWCALQYPFNIPPAPSGAPHAISDCEEYGDGFLLVG